MVPSSPLAGWLLTSRRSAPTAAVPSLWHPLPEAAGGTLASCQASHTPVTYAFKGLHYKSATQQPSERHARPEAGYTAPSSSASSAAHVMLHARSCATQPNSRTLCCATSPSMCCSSSLTDALWARMQARWQGVSRALTSAAAGAAAAAGRPACAMHKSVCSMRAW